MSAPQNVIYEKKATLQSTYGGLVQTIDQYDLLVQEFHVIIPEALIHKNPLKIVFFWSKSSKFANHEIIAFKYADDSTNITS